MLKKYLPLYLVVLLIASLAVINGCGSGATSGGGGGGGGSSFSTISITITPEGTGTVDAVPGFACVTGTTVELTATPTNASTHVFGSWEGDFVGLTSPLNLYVNGNKKITAVFRPIDISRYYDLTIATDSGGTTSPAPGTSSYAEGTVVVVTAEAAPGSVFDSWSGDQSGTKETTSITMNASKEISAHFKALHILSVSVTPEGSGTVEPFGGIYKEGTVVRLTAEAGSGYKFSTWEGDVSGFTITTTITMNSDKLVTAEFTPITTTHGLLGVIAGLWDETGTKCFSHLLISSDATFYLDAKDGNGSGTGTWSLLPCGFLTIESSTLSEPINYIYGSPHTLAISVIGNYGDGLGGVIWTAAPTVEPADGSTYNLIRFPYSGKYDHTEPGDEIYYVISISTGHIGDFALYDITGESRGSASGVSMTYNKGLFTSPSLGGTFVRLCQSPSNMMLGTVGNDTDHYTFMVGGKERAYTPTELSGKEFVGLITDSTTTAYIAGLGNDNGVNVSAISVPITSSDYTGIDAARISFEADLKTGVERGTMSVGTSESFNCDAVIAKVGPSQDKFMICGVVSGEAISGDQYHVSHFFLIEK